MNSLARLWNSNGDWLSFFKSPQKRWLQLLWLWNHQGKEERRKKHLNHHHPNSRWSIIWFPVSNRLDWVCVWTEMLIYHLRWVIVARGLTWSPPCRLGVTGSFNQALLRSDGKQIGHRRSPAVSIVQLNWTDSFCNNLQQKEGQDVDISGGVDPLISEAIIAFWGRSGRWSGGAFTADASELISGKRSRCFRLQYINCLKPSGWGKSLKPFGAKT